MRISTAYDAGKLVIRLAGELDHHGAREAMREIDGLIDEYLPRDTALDMEGLSFMDSSGIGLILGRLRQVSPIGGNVYLFGGSPSMRKMWEMSGILGKVTVLDTVEEMKEVYE